MLSVQTAGCAGMERLGVPTRTTLNAPPDDRGQYICRMHIDAARELLGVRSEPVIRGNHHQHQQQQQHHNNTDHTHHHQQHHQHFLVNHRTTSLAAASPASPTTPASSGNNSISNNNINNNSNNYNNNLPPMTNNTDFASSGGTSKGGGSSTLKYNNMCCGNGSSGDGGGSSNNSSCCHSLASQSSLSSHSHDHHQHYQHQLQQQKTLCCPHHVPLPDSEWIPADQRPAQLRSSYQHSELTRSYIKPPPNKTVKDVPDRSSYNFYSSTSTHSSNSGLHSLTSSQSLPLSYAPSLASTGSGSGSSSSSSSSSVAQPKSKPNVITKFFYRKSSPKSPNNVASSSSSSSSSASSASSSSAFSSSAACPPYAPLASSSSSSIASSACSLLTSAGSTSSTMPLCPQQPPQSSIPLPLVMAPVLAPTLSIATAASLKTTPCDYGPTKQAPHNSGTCINHHISTGLVPSTQLLTTIGVSHPTATTTFPQTAMQPNASMERIPTPPLSVSVPINIAYQQQQRQQQQQQHLLLDCLVGDTASVSSTLQNIKSSSCSPTLSATTTANAANASLKDDFVMECQSGNITRNNSSSSMQSLTSSAANCNCQHPHCKHCNHDAATSA